MLMRATSSRYIRHGIGLSSVKSTLKKYKSEISFSEDKYWFTVLIVIDKYEYIH